MAQPKLCPRTSCDQDSKLTCITPWRVRCGWFRRNWVQRKWTLRWSNRWKVSTQSCRALTHRWTHKRCKTLWSSSLWKPRRWACNRRWCRTSSKWLAIQTQTSKLKMFTNRSLVRSACKWTVTWRRTRTRLRNQPPPRRPKVEMPTFSPGLMHLRACEQQPGRWFSNENSPINQLNSRWPMNQKWQNNSFYWWSGDQST